VTVTTEVKSYCRICIAQCGIVVTLEQGDGEPRVTHVRGDVDHPVSAGYTCAKGRNLPALHHHAQRLEQPRLRGAEVGAEEVLDDLAARIAAIVERDGPDAVAFFFATGVAFDAAGRTVAEKFFRKLGTRSKYSTLSIDSPSKPIASELVGGWPWINPVTDEDSCRLALLIGINPVISHGHTSSMTNPRAILVAQRERGELWVLDPRVTETAKEATRHLQNLPSTDAYVLGHLVRELLVEGADEAYLEAHGSDVPRLAEAVEPFTRARTAELTGLDETDLAALVAAVRRAGRISVVTGTGASMGPGANVTEWFRLALLVVTGSIDRPGGMWCNPGFLSRLDTRRLPISPPDGLVEDRGPRSRPDLHRQFGELPCAALASEIEAGYVKALVVVGGNPLRSLPDSEGIAAAFAKLEVLAVADVVENEMTRTATHVLPSAGLLERADLSLFLDAFLHRVMAQRSAPVVPLVGGRKPVWWWFAALAERLGLDVLPEGMTLDTASDDALLEPVVARSMDPAALPPGMRVALAEEPSTFGWITERVLPEGRWRLAPALLVQQLEELLAAPDRGLVFIPRRQLRTMNSQYRDSLLRGETPLADVLVHPSDADAAGLADGDLVRVVGRHGATEGRAHVTTEIREGAVSVPHGWGAPDVQRLTSAHEDVDPLTGMVLLGGLPVRLEPVRGG
jgi:anaerobic selenocysteine-containing dehydrogenase